MTTLSSSLSSTPYDTAARDLWLRRFHPSPQAAARLVCLPHAGGSASYYHPLSAALSPDVEALVVQYPGRQDRRAEPLVDDLHVLADRISDALAAEPGPLALFGHSMGAVLAYEVTRRLERDGRDVTALFVSGRRAPSTHREEKLHRVGDAQLLDEMRRLSGTEASLLDDEEIVRMVLPAIRNDFRAVETYRHQPGGEPELRCPVTALIGADDPRVTAAEAGQWRVHTSAPFDLHTYPGGHFYLTSVTTELAHLLRARLAPAG